MRTLRLTIAYDGTDYAGWQFQPDQPTVQQTLETALEKVTGQRIRVLASGRTDAGVHALGQAVRVETESSLPADVLRRALNANLPDDIAVLDVTEVPEGYHPTSDVVRKRYRYVIHDGPVRDVFHRRYCWHYIYARLDAEAMHRAAAALLGKHDFRSFETSGAERATSVRTIFDISVRRGRAGREGLDAGGVSPGHCDVAETGAGEGGYLPHAEREECITIEVEADGFLYNMVRAIVGTLVEVGRGRRPESWPGEVLRAMNRRAAGPTAPPQGLFLVRVEY
ncbi:MAG: tRNA pseudouridine(38-40) synthase TruA [Planctomycetaceae bacterium]|nr:tRNA pseudouridine(38-40) synthase TruA [Planctomycetaceae bacterium]